MAKDDDGKEYRMTDLLGRCFEMFNAINNVRLWACFAECRSDAC